MSRNRPATCPPGMRPCPAMDGHGSGVGAGRSSRCPQKPTAKSSIPKRGPPPAPPKKVDYKNPQMTRAMMHRTKHNQQFQEELERRDCKDGHQSRRPRRQQTAPPTSRRQEGRSLGRSTGRAPPPPPSSQPPMASRRMGPGVGPGVPGVPGLAGRPTGPAAPGRPGRPGGAGRSSGLGGHGGIGGPSQRMVECGRNRPHTESAAPCVPEHTMNLAKTFNADIVQAEPMQRGPVDNIIIPPGTINSEKTTIVSIPLAEEPNPRNGLACSTMNNNNNTQPPNKSIQIINETLDEQDAMEAAVVNSKLQELQHARRQFMTTVAHMGVNNLPMEDSGIDDCFDDIDDITPPSMLYGSPGAGRGLYPPPDLEDPYYKPDYGLNHPVVEAAREYMRCRQSERKFEDEFARLAQEGPVTLDSLPNYVEGPPFDDDFCYDNTYTPIPKRQQPYQYDCDFDRLERFCDTKNYPPSSPPPRGQAPAGRKGMNPDLWEMDDPWYCEPDAEDLIDWNSNSCGD